MTLSLAVAAACGGGSGASAPTVATPAGCTLVVQPHDDRSASFIGEGFPPDSAVRITIEFADRPRTDVLTEADFAELHTDARGRFEVRLSGGPSEVGHQRATAEAGGCAATVEFTVAASLFPRPCPVASARSAGGAESATYAAVILSDQPLHYWPLDEAGTEQVAADVVGDADAAHIATPAIGQPGAFVGSRSVFLDGVADGLRTPRIELSGDFTVEAWVLICDEITNQDAVTGDASTGQSINFFEERLRLFDGSGDPAVASERMPYDRWAYVAVTRSGVDLVLYLDGESVGSGSYAGGFAVTEIGGSPVGSLSGFIDEVAIYGHALDAASVAARVEAAAALAGD